MDERRKTLGSTKKRAGIGLAALGVALVIFGLVWVTIIFPGLKKVPDDLNKTVQYDGVVTMIDPEVNSMTLMLGRRSVGGKLRAS